MDKNTFKRLIFVIIFVVIVVAVILIIQNTNKTEKALKELGYSEEDLMLLLTYAVEKGMNLNQRTSMYGDTYMHALIECDDYYGSLAPFLYFGYLHGFKPTIENYCGKNVWDALKDPDTTKIISNSDKELCFKIKKLYELKEEKEKLEKIQKEIMLLQQEEHDLEKSIDQNKSLVYEIENILGK